MEKDLCLAPQGPEGHPLRPLFPEGSSHSYSWTGPSEGAVFFLLSLLPTHSQLPTT